MNATNTAEIFIWTLIIYISILPVEGQSFYAVGGVVAGDTFLCGESVKLVCVSQPHPLTLVLSFGSIQVIRCYFGSCRAHDNYTSAVSYSLNNGNFNFTIDAVKSSEHSQLFTCIIDGQTYQISSKVAEFSTSLTITSYNVSNGIKVQALTGCVFPSENITFEWFIVKVNASQVDQFYPSNLNTTENNTMCVSSVNCNDTGLSSSFIIDPHKPPVRESVYFRVRVSHQYALDKLFSEQQTQQYFDFSEENVNNAISDSTGCFSKTECTIGAAFGISFAIILLLALVVLIYIVFILRKRKSVDGCPNSPTGLRLISKTDTLATFTWTPGPNPEGQNKFRLCYKKLDDKTSTLKEIKVNGTKETIKDLQPGCMYQCYVYKMTGNRKSDNSKPIDFTTLGQPDSPTKFKIINVTENSFLLHWTPGCYRKYGQTFVLECKDTKTGKPRVIYIEEKTAASIPFEYPLDSLSPGTEYQLMLYAENKLGSSARIGPIIQTTLGLPDEPTHLQTVPDTVTETTVTLTWKPGKYRKYRQTFVVSYRLKDEKNLRWTDLLAQDEPKPTILNKVVDLKEGKTYEFKIYAKNGIGVSKTSNIISVETKGKPESPCELAEVESERTSKSITVSWIPGTYRRDTQKFVLNYARASNGRNLTWKHNVLVDDGHSPEIKVKIGGLRAGQSYHIAINAINHTGRTSEMSNTITVKTEELLPQPPAEFVCCNIVETKVQLSWKPVIYQQKQSFYLTYSSEKDQWSEVVPFDNNHEKVEHNVSNLTPGTVYEFSVWSFFGNFNDGKISERCEIQWIKTKDKSTDTES